MSGNASGFSGPMDLPLVLQAVVFAAEKHRGQVRKDADSTPYIQHPVGLASLLWEVGVHDADTLAAAILHDTIEDTPTTHDELESAFSRSVADLVAEVTDDKRQPKAMRKKRQVEHAAHLSAKACYIKLADKICNLRDVASAAPVGWSLERRREYFEWARAVVQNLPEKPPKLMALFEEAYSAKP